MRINFKNHFVTDMWADTRKTSRLQINGVRSHAVHYSGFTLIEVLIALFVLSVGLLGLAMLQVQSLKFNTDAYFRSQATILANDIMERMRGNPAGVATGAYTVTDNSDATAAISAYSSCSSSGCDCDGGTQCSTSNLATFDLGIWYENLNNALPNGHTDGRSTIELTGTSGGTLGTARQFTITIRWRERDLDMQQQWLVELFG